MATEMGGMHKFEFTYAKEVTIYNYKYYRNPDV